ncbi:hypothetical protein QWZ10_17960 [Paracoccus cavernae]|uniref:Uncharacterized protein n=1 Tax=Paracoccus cavernae TaxID=1571207 RepID=A0ABT8DB91_9RHOB|nr:hypothetical protein [Paracoccus cavernae]
MTTPQALMMLLIWPIVVSVMFNRLPRQQAIIWSILAGYLVLPPVAEIDLPLFPSLNKAIIPALSAAFFNMLKKDEALIAEPPRYSGPVTLFLGMLLIAPILSALTNPDALIEGSRSGRASHCRRQSANRCWFSPISCLSPWGTNTFPIRRA